MAGLNHDWDHPGPNHADFIHGGVGVNDFDETFRYKKVKKVKKPKKPRTRPGCPADNYGPHVFVWTSEGVSKNIFFDHYGYHKWEHETCAGCKKRRNARLTERYMKVKERKWRDMMGDGSSIQRGIPVSRRLSWGQSFPHWQWEDEDETYVKRRNDYIDRNGWSSSYIYPRWSYDWI